MRAYAARLAFEQRGVVASGPPALGPHVNGGGQPQLHAQAASSSHIKSHKLAVVELAVTVDVSLRRADNLDDLDEKATTADVTYRCIWSSNDRFQLARGANMTRM